MIYEDEELIVAGTPFFVQFEGHATRDRRGEPQIMFDRLLVDGDKPNDALRELVEEALEAKWGQTIIEDMPSDDEILAAIWDDKYHAMVEEGLI